MQVVLHLLLICDDPAMKETGETYIMLQKKYDLPFVPFPGLLLKLEAVEPSLPELASRLQQLGGMARVTGICQIRRVRYDAEYDEFTLEAQEGYVTIQEFHAATEYYRLRYGLGDFP